MGEISSRIRALHELQFTGKTEIFALRRGRGVNFGRKNACNCVTEFMNDPLRCPLSEAGCTLVRLATRFPLHSLLVCLRFGVVWQGLVAVCIL